MGAFVDLSHEFYDGMPGFRIADGDGGYTEYSASIRPFLTHTESEPLFDGRCSFEITEMEFQTSVGTYLDAPAHRFPDTRDISDLNLSELVNDSIVIDVQGHDPGESVDTTVLPTDQNLAGKAILFNFGWDSYWGTEQYREYPYLGTDVIDQLIAEEVALVGVDTINIDDDQNLDRPAHTKLLGAEVFIVENLCNLDELPDSAFRFYAIPIKAADTVAMPIRAFAEVL